MKTYLQFLAFCTFFSAFSQNPSDLDQDFNVVPIPENRYCLDRKVTTVGTTSTGNMLIYDHLEGLSYIDAEQNLIRHFNFFGSGPSFILQGDDKAIVVLNGSPTWNGVPVPNIFRINLSSGLIDSSFNLDPNITVNNVASSQIHIWNNKLYVKAGSVLVNGVFKTIFRLNLDGSIDTTFNYTSISYHDAYFMPDGTVFMYRANASPRLIRVNTDGTVNATFQPINTLGEPYDIIGISNTEFYFLGAFQYNDVYHAGKIIKFYADGSVASDFPLMPSGFGITSMAMQSDNKLIVAGNQIVDGAWPDFFVKRLLPNGEIDTTFEHGDFGSSSNSSLLLEVLPNDKFYLSRSTFFRRNNVLIKRFGRYNANGSYDQSFDNPCKGFIGNVSVIEEQADGKLLIGGGFSSYNGIETRACFIRLHPDGTIDEPFLSNLGEVAVTSLGMSPNSIDAIKAMPDGKLLIAGHFDYEGPNGVSSKSLMVLNSDGTIFKAYPESLMGRDFHIELQSDGRPLIYGNMAFLAGSTTNSKVIRLDSNYDADPTYGPSYVSSQFKKFKVLPDDKVLVNGQYASGNNFRKYDSNGIPDNTFNLSNQFVENFEVRNDGKIVSLRQTGASPPYEFARMSSDGNLETSIVQTIHQNAFLIQADNKIIFINPDRNLVRYTENGTLDPSFELKTFSGVSPSVIKFLSDGRIAIGGSGEFFDAQPVGNLAILQGEKRYFLQGENKLDINLNGCTNDDPAFPNLRFEISNGTDTFNYITNVSGAFNTSLLAGDYTITPHVGNPNYFTVSPTSIQVTFPQDISPINQNFCVVPIGVHQDLEVVLIPTTSARPGFDAEYKIIYKNIGNQVSNGTLNFNYPATLMELVSSVPTPSDSDSNSLNFTFSNLLPMEMRMASLVFNINSPTETPAVNGGDILNISATFSSIGEDQNVLNNTSQLNQVVENAYDPNDKTCLEGQTVSTELIGEYVHYVIRFENTGNGNAERVVITDYIDVTKFDVETLVPLNGSHLFVTRIIDNEVNFIFDQINLPFTEDQNRGYVCFKIKLKDVLTENDTFANQAEIYFDYNSAIITNNEISSFQTLTVEEQLTNSNVSIYPNPTNGQVIVQSESLINQIAVYDIKGRLLQTKIIDGIETQLDLTAQPAGIYLLKILCDYDLSTVKIIKR